MSLLRLYLRVIGLLAPEKTLAITLAVANLALAGVYFLEPWLFGRVVDALAAQGHHDAWRLIGWWAAVGIGGVVASVWVSLHADRLAHRRRPPAAPPIVRDAGAVAPAVHHPHHPRPPPRLP